VKVDLVIGKVRAHLVLRNGVAHLVAEDLIIQPVLNRSDGLVRVVEPLERLLARLQAAHVPHLIGRHLQLFLGVTNAIFLGVLAN
jgi:hypothetical protein